MAEVETLPPSARWAAGIIHLGATSMDIQDNADALRLRSALALVRQRMQGVMAEFANKIEQLADVPTMAFTHLQPAEPTTMGYRLAQYGQDLLRGSRAPCSQVAHAMCAARGFKGAVGTALPMPSCWRATGFADFDWKRGDGAARPRAISCSHPDLSAQSKTGWYSTALAGLRQRCTNSPSTCGLLQAPALWGVEPNPSAPRQVGSSAMPFKRNPINAENIDSLARASWPRCPAVAWENAALSHLERTLDDSANRRVVLPEAFLLTDEALIRATALVEGMQIWPAAVARNLRDYGLFAATERVLMAAVRAGGDRQSLHEVIREHSLAAWAALQTGAANPLADLLAADPRIAALIPSADLAPLLDASAHVGDAAPRARALATAIRDALAVRAMP
jgi:adenylosuccinate lyase